jgi:mannose-1-phosphate guanylyltransferase/mannose-6-phosphate isomerase
MIIPIILAGGKGKRLWPLSNAHTPKQFLSFVNDKTLLQDTLERIKAMPNVSQPIIMCNTAHRFMVAEQAQEIEKPTAIMLEPEGRNTAPSIIIAALYALKQFNDPLLLVMPSDHYLDFEYFSQRIIEAEALANLGKLVIFGITPTSAQTSYGYIKVGSPFEKTEAHSVDQFVEKPNAASAKRYLESGNYFWNSGMFLFKASSILEATNQIAPDLLKACQHVIETAHNDEDFIRFTPEAMQQCPNISIDYAIMEKTQDAIVLSYTGAWVDLGNWKNIWEISEKNHQNNVIKGNVMTVNTENSYLYSSSRFILAIGVKDQIIIETPKAILVAAFDQIDEIKRIAEKFTDE